MAVSVLLDLRHPVSIPDLQQFLSYLPESYDTEEDLRTTIEAGGAVHGLEIHLPVPELP